MKKEKPTSMRASKMRKIDEVATSSTALGRFLTRDAPFGVLLNIALQMPINDVLHYCHVNQRLRAVCQTSEFWKRRIAQDMGPSFVEQAPAETLFDQTLYSAIHRRVYGPYPGYMRITAADNEEHYRDYSLVPDATVLVRFYTDRLIAFQGRVKVEFPGPTGDTPVTGHLELDNGEGRARLSNGIDVEIIRPWGTDAQVVDLYIYPRDPNAHWPWKRVFKEYPRVEDRYERLRLHHRGVDHALTPARSLFLKQVNMAPIM